MKDENPSDIVFTKKRLLSVNLKFTAVAAGGDGAIWTFRRWIKVYAMTSNQNGTYLEFLDNFNDETSSVQLIGSAAGPIVNQGTISTQGFLFNGSTVVSYVFNLPIITKQVRITQTGGANNKYVTLFYL